MTRSTPAKVSGSTRILDLSEWLFWPCSESRQVKCSRTCSDGRDTGWARRGQLERDHEGHAARGVRWGRRLPPQLLRQPVRRAPLLRRVRPDGAVRPRQRRGRCPHETPWRISQAGGGTILSILFSYVEFILLHIYMFYLKHNQVKLEDLFLAQCFKLCFLETKERLTNFIGKSLSPLEKRMKAELTYKIETYFDWNLQLISKVKSKK